MEEKEIIQKILVIVGPTASGKSELGVRLARKFDGEVISADSRQVYRGLNVGTGKITKREMLGVRHHLIDVMDLKKQFSVSDFVRLTNSTIVEIVNRARLPIIVGGTGFYIDAVTGSTGFPNVKPNKLLRSKLNKLDSRRLYNMLKKKDSGRAKTIDRYNKVRLIRALEIINKLGKVPMWTPSVHTRKFLFIGLKLDANKLRKRTRIRLEKRLSGMIREARYLHRKGFSYRHMHKIGLEYRYLALYLQGKLNKFELVSKLDIEIWHYAKRQMTWFKRNKAIRWFNLSSIRKLKSNEYKDIEKYVRIALETGD
jgi:tRNA dimethylallyltransferase